MDAIVVGDDHPPPAHPGKSTIEGWVVDIDRSPKRSDERGEQLIEGVTRQARFEGRPSAKHSRLCLLEGAEGHDRTVQPQKQLDGNFAQPLQVPYYLKVVTRSAAGILQRKDLMVIEDAHEASMLSGPLISHQNRQGRLSGARQTGLPTYNGLSAMKFTLAIPSVRIPQAPTISYAPEFPRVRIPFLSLLLEPRPLKKWIMIWLLCLYLAFCWGCFFYWEQPRLNHDNYVRFGADSPTYWDAVKYRSEHAENDDLVSFSGNLLGPVMIGMVFRNGIAVALFNIFLFFIAVEVACTIPGVDRYRLVLLLVLCSETAPALVTLNKEILVLL